MQELIKKIRSYMNMNQTEFAEQLNVTFATVNRWENGRALPNKLAQDKIYGLCKEHNVPVSDMVLEKIEAASKSIELEQGRMLLYHGSKSGIQGDIAPKSRKQCDFGEGFYMGTEPGQALTLICDYESARFYIVSISVENLDVLDVPADLEWAMIVAYHRGRMEKIKGTAFYNKYKEITKNKDLVIGNIANDICKNYRREGLFFDEILDQATVR